MNTTRTCLITRITGAAASVVVTLVLFSGVISASEPQRSRLAALNHHQPVAEPRLAVAQAATQQLALTQK